MFAVTVALFATSASKSKMVLAIWLPVWLDRFNKLASVSFAVAPSAIAANFVASSDG